MGVYVFCNVWVCLHVIFVIVWVCECVDFVIYECFFNCLFVLVICVLVFILFCIDSFMYIYSYLLLV